MEQKVLKTTSNTIKIKINEQWKDGYLNYFLIETNYVFLMCVYLVSGSVKIGYFKINCTHN